MTIHDALATAGRAAIDAAARSCPSPIDRAVILLFAKDPDTGAMTLECGSMGAKDSGEVARLVAQVAAVLSSGDGFVRMRVEERDTTLDGTGVL